MGYNQIVVVALLLSTPLAYGQTLLPNTRLDVTGRICCTSNGNCPPGSVGIPGVAVRLNCTSILSAVGPFVTNVTGLNGDFSLTLPILSTTLGPVLNGISPCNVLVNLPLNSTVCPLLSTTIGTLLSAASPVKNTVSALLDLVGAFVADAFRLVINV